MRIRAIDGVLLLVIAGFTALHSKAWTKISKKTDIRKRLKTD